MIHCGHCHSGTSIIRNGNGLLLALDLMVDLRSDKGGTLLYLNIWPLVLCVNWEKHIASAIIRTDLTTSDIHTT